MLKQFNVIDEFERGYFDIVNDSQLDRSGRQMDNEIPQNLADLGKPDQLLISSDENENNNKLSEFISKIYQGCKNHDIHPDELVNWAKNLIEFATKLDEINNYNINQNEFKSPSENSYTIPKVSELSTYIESKKRQYSILKKQVSILISRKHDLKNQINKKTEQLNDLSKKENVALQYLKWYSDLHDELRNNYNIDIKLVYGNFAKVINDFRKYDFDPIKIINDYRNMDSLRERFNEFTRNNAIMIDNRNNLHQQVASLENQVFLFDRKIKNIEELQNMGFGIEELEQLSIVVTHIASTNKIDKDLSVQKFIKDVASQYDSKLGFETTISLLNEEKRKIENEIPAYRAFINTKVVATQSIDFLQDHGVTVFDIIGISLMMKAFLSGKFAFYPSKSTKTINLQGNKIENNNIKSWQMFIDYLKNLNDSMIELDAKRIELNNITTQIDSKIVEKQQIDSQLTNSIIKLNNLTEQGINFMNTLNQFSAIMHANMTTTKILPMVFVNSHSPTDSQASESLDNNESEEQSE